ncbi:methyltransferase domain-containing protein [candidate division KSB3 bacterium]|uniref:Methyltransferase domain-containing protein n=1 Tax=candidate division KSB3 bacterium TaxID=2044937 RepID=A0A9D5Q7F3_9BACT|nr:methyltransferase domain-containing protein [candidate division KSB3 bacterium]MBD3326383.1 methyltransferase domain-containing protein [candidate division KSB3 bacterium]
MSNSIIPPESANSDAVPPQWLDQLARKWFFPLLHRLQYGKITLIEGHQQQSFGQQTEDVALQATITVHHPRFYSRVVFGGTIGAAEAYMAGYWTTDDLTTVVRIVLRNQALFGTIDSGWAKLTKPAYKLYHYLHKDTKAGSRINIAAHYDLGNDFYRLFLDETLTYSCGIFETASSSLTEASVAKYDRLCQKLQLSQHDHVLEIGTGWGGFAVHAATHYGCRITTTTISRQQYEFAQERFRQAGITDRVELLYEDYRDLKGTYTKLVSIEMIEAVGYQYFETFFKVCSDCLKPDGMMAIQAITIADHAFERHKRSVDFIKRYIFPGSCIPSVTALCQAMARVTDLRLVHLEDITPHYATTLRMWRERLFQHLDQVRELGYSDTFIRMWDYYFSYCEAGFTERYLGDVHLLFTKPLCRRSPILPPLSAAEPIVRH